MYTSLKKNILKHTTFEPEELNAFCALFERKLFKKKSYLLTEGDICQFEGFIDSGLCKVYHRNDKGTEQILYFAVEDWWVTDLDSFNRQKPSQLFIEVLEDSVIYIISKAKKERAFEQFPAVEKLFRVMTQKAYANLQRRMVDNLTKTADIRYMEFIDRYPHIAHRLSNIQIAAYLGISHEFLSKIRRKMVERKDGKT